MNNWIKEHVAELIFGTCLAGTLGAGIWAVLETPKAMKEVETKTTKKEKGLTYVKHYAGPALLYTASVIGECCVLKNKNDTIAGLAAAVVTSQKSVSDIKAAAKKVLSPEDQKKLNEEVGAKKLEEKKEDIACLQGSRKPGDRLIMCAWDGQIFYGDPGSIDWAFDNVYLDLMEHGVAEYQYRSINDITAYIPQLRRTRLGELMGWNATDGITKEAFRPTWGSCLVDDENKTQALLLDFGSYPRDHYTKRKQGRIW